MSIQESLALGLALLLIAYWYCKTEHFKAQFLKPPQKRYYVIQYDVCHAWNIEVKGFQFDSNVPLDVAKQLILNAHQDRWTKLDGHWNIYYTDDVLLGQPSSVLWTLKSNNRSSSDSDFFGYCHSAIKYFSGFCTKGPSAEAISLNRDTDGNLTSNKKG